MVFLNFYSNFNMTFCEQTVGTMIAASDVGLHCLPMSNKKAAIPLVFKTFVLSIFEWPLKTGFNVSPYS